MEQIHSRQIHIPHFLLILQRQLLKFLKYYRTHFLNIRGTVYDFTTVQIHVFSHSKKHRRIGGQLEAGDRLTPQPEPLPVVKQTTFAPDATCPVTETGSYPGESIISKPFVLIGSAY